MSIIMQVFRHGKLIGQCDAKCYAANTDKCSCVCFGDHHGIGRNLAVQKLRTKKYGWRQTYNHNCGYDVKFF